MAEPNPEHGIDRQDAPDALEAELASFQPRTISPGLQLRIGSELARPGARRRRVLPTAAGLMAAAACVALGFVLWRGGGGGGGGENSADVADKQTTQIAATGPAERIAASDPSPPTVMEFQRAFAGPPAALDELLAWPAGRGRRGDRAAAQDVATAFTRSATLLNTTNNGDPL